MSAVIMSCLPFGRHCSRSTERGCHVARLVWGINEESIQMKLLQEKDLTLQKALTLAQGSETATKNVKEMNAPQQEWTSNRV